SSFSLQLQPEEAKQILNNPKIYHKVLTSPKNKKKRNILNIVGENNFDLLKYIFESEYFPSYKEQFYDYIDSISYESFQKILEAVNLTKITDAIFKEKSVEELENLTGIG